MKFNYLTMLMASSALAMTATAAAAQEAQGDIVVTARKQNETLISVPVVVSAVSAEQLEKRAIANLDGVSRAVPQLMIAPQGGSVQGGNVAIRAIAGPDSNPFGDQAVSFVIDGVAISKSSVRRMSDTDLSQIEVLKGPQALFYGKNSPGGIVSIRSADPKDRFEAKISTGYEFQAEEWRTEGYVSGPITDQLGARIAGYYSEQKGDLTDATPEDNILRGDAHATESKDYSLRGTLKYEPTDNFDARFKLNLARTKNNGPASRTGFHHCANGVRFTEIVASGFGVPITPQPCTVKDGDVVNAGYGPGSATLGGTLNKYRPDGKNFQDQQQYLTGLEMNWRPMDGVTISSVSGYYEVKLEQCQNYNNDAYIVLPSCNLLYNKEFSQELRATTDFDGPLNFTAGAYWSQTDTKTGSLTLGFANGFDLADLFGLPAAFGFTQRGGVDDPFIVNNYYFGQNGYAWSAFGQARWDITPQLELDVGGRYSEEIKNLKFVRNGGGIAEGTPGVVNLDDSTLVIPATNKGSFNDFSPEVTLSYRPTEQFTLFGSYKEGFLSGGFNSSSSTLPNGVDLAYDQQRVDGFEVGAKSKLLDGALYLQGAVYDYDIKGLQVTNFTGTVSTIRNAGAASVKGAEIEANYKTPIEGLSFNAAAAYNKAEYTRFDNAPCYIGQSIAQGCTLTGPGGTAVQDLEGTPLARAPTWNANVGFD
ncbi:MAG: TonB-dependent receptor, partial [Caulobacterales bacterium]